MAETRLIIEGDLPNASEAEKRVLGMCFVSAAALAEVAGLLKPSDFYHRANQSIYAAILQLWESGKGVDRISLEAALKAKRLFEASGGLAYLCELETFEDSTIALPHYADLIRKAAMRRDAIRISEEATRAALDPSSDPLEVLSSAESQMRGVATRSVKAKARAIGEIIDDVVVGLEANRAEDAPNFIQTGFCDVDHILHGLHPGDLIILAARPGMGKTAMALNIATDVAQRQKKSVMLFSLEMSENEVASRVISSLSAVTLNKVDASAFRKMKLSDVEMHNVCALKPLAHNLPLYVDDTAALPVMDLRIRAKQMHLQGHCDLIVIDYLQLVHGAKSSQNREQEVADISRSLKALAKELKVPVIALSQLNRSLEQRGDKRPQMSDLRESGSIEQDADVIIFLYRDEVYNKEKSSKKGLCEVIIGKHRHGPIGDVVLAYNGKHTTFMNYAPEGAYYGD